MKLPRHAAAASALAVPAGSRTTTAASDATPVADALRQAGAQGLDRLDAQLLLAHMLQRPRTWLLGHGEATLSPTQRGTFETLCARRADGVPLAYLTGEREFHGLALRITPDVLDPRPDTETLVDWALQLLGATFAAAPAVADLGTGSGAIALALKHRCPRAAVTATDASAAALDAARTNAARHGLGIEMLQGDWWRPLGDRRFDLAVSNPPYLAEGDPHLAALRHEPRAALVAGDAGLAAIRAIVAGAPAHLHPGGWLLLEHGHEQAAAVRRLLAGAGFEAVQSRDDLARRPRCTGGRWLLAGPRWQPLDGYR